MRNGIWLVAIAAFASGLIGAWAFTQATEPPGAAPPWRELRGTDRSRSRPRPTPRGSSVRHDAPSTGRRKALAAR